MEQTKPELTPKEKADRRKEMMRKAERDFKLRRHAMAKALPRVQRLYLVAAGLQPEAVAPKGADLVEALDVARQCIYRCRTYEALYFDRKGLTVADFNFDEPTPTYRRREREEEDE